MAPPEQYMMERTVEIALARSGAPASISKDATVMVLGRHGYETASKGTNGFVCLVERAWTSGIDDPQFWNPKNRSAICFNPPAVRSVVPVTLKKSEMFLAGRSKTQVFDALKIAFDKKEIPPVEPGAMCYMMSKDSYLNDAVPHHWKPHLMFFEPLMDVATWGSDMAGAPLVGFKMPEDRLTLFMIPVAKWSDGTAAETH